MIEEQIKELNEESAPDMHSARTVVESPDTETFAQEVTPSYNRNERFIPTEFALIDYQRSWKKCRCGRVTGFKDNYCPACGQRLGQPKMED